MVLPLKKLATLSLQYISLISFVKTACIFFPLAHYERMSERTACAPFPEDEISAEDNCISRPRANVQFVVSAAVAVAECAGYSAHLFSHEARSLCYAHKHRHRTVVSAPWSASASEIYASLRAYLDIKHVQTCPTSVVQPPRGPQTCTERGVRSRLLNFVYTLTVAWRAFGADPITPGKISRDAHVNLTIQNRDCTPAVSHCLCFSPCNNVSR